MLGNFRVPRHWPPSVSCRSLRTMFFVIAEVKILFLKPEEEKDKTHFTDKEVNMKVCYAPVREMCGFKMLM